MTKVCFKCRKRKPRSAFGRCRDRYSLTGLKSYCKPCATKSSADSRKRNPDRLLRSQLKQRYGLTLEDYRDLLREQNNRCAICGSPFSGQWLMGKPHVDHCHKSGRVRALLCRNCNTGLGMFKESRQILLLAADYAR